MFRRIVYSRANGQRIRPLRFEPLEDRHLLAAVTGFILINADTDLPLGSLTAGQTLNLANLPSQNLNVRADTVDSIGSVRFRLDATTNFKTENTSPYALFGDQNGDYNAGSFSLGSHTLTATPFSQSNANGTAGTALSVSFTVINQSTPINQPPTVNAGPDLAITLPTNSANLDGTVADDNFPSNPLTTNWAKFSGPGTVSFGNINSVDTTAAFSQAGNYVLRLTADDGQFVRSDDVLITVNSQPTGPGVTSFTLINAVTDQPMFTITDGMSIDLAQLSTTKVNIRANTTGVVRSVVFDYDGTSNVRVDSSSPYALFSESGGNFQPVILGLGNHAMTAACVYRLGRRWLADQLADTELPSRCRSSHSRPDSSIVEGRPLHHTHRRLAHLRCLDSLNPAVSPAGINNLARPNRRAENERDDR